MEKSFDWNSVISILTLGTLIVTYRQLRRSSKIQEIDIYFKIKEEFKSNNSVQLIECIIDNKIGLSSIQLDIPKLIDTRIEHEDVFLKNDLLDHIEDLSIFYDRGLISKKLITEGYGTIIIKTYECEMIKLYIDKVRNYYNDKYLYEGLQKLYILIKNI